MAVSTDRRGIDRMRWRATRRIVLARDQYRCRKDELAAGAPGEAGKGPLPKRPGRDLYRAAADRRNTTRLPHGRSAGNRTEPTEAPPPHICERLTALAAGSGHPGCRRHWCLSCDQIWSRFCAGVRTGLQACAGRRLHRPAAASRNGEHARTPTGRTADRRRPPVPTATPRRRRRASTYSAQRRRRTSTALPARALFITRGAFRRLIAAGAPTV